ncbi:MAG: HPr family phosphocarrier protein [Clostridiales bacterium]|nr:HPr family phosphocarrier protein [Clostridiales bacterium]
MVKASITIKNASGLHLRPTGVLCNEAIKYQSSIRFLSKNNTSETNAKSVLSVLGACIKYGDEITFVCEGPDEEQALAAMLDAIESGLGESVAPGR